MVLAATAAGVVAACGSSGSERQGFGSGGTSAAGGIAGMEGGAATGGGGGGGVGNITGTGGTGGSSDAGVGAACDTTIPCATGLVCAGGTCIEGEGDCQSDVDCGGDTYCCSGACLPDGSLDGTCVPYGTGPRGDQNPDCKGSVEIGQFFPALQCEWTAPPVGDPFPDHIQVLATPLVADLPNDSGAAAEIVIVSYNFNDGGAESAQGSNPAYFGVIRVLSGQTCEQLESIHDPANPMIAASPPALADLDNDGTIEIVTHRAGGGLIAFKFNPTVGRYETFWAGTGATNTGLRWDGPSVHDLDDDGFPEVISEAEVYDGRTGARRNPGQALLTMGTSVIAVVGDVDADGNVELVQDSVYRWNRTTNMWDVAYPGAGSGFAFAYADFGTPGATPADFDATQLDGIAEVVASGDNAVVLATLQGQILINAPLAGELGGPPTIGDFDNDGFPEIASAGGTAFRVFDLDCANAATPGCAAQYIRWSQPSQDSSSSRTGSSIFDFEGDGKAEAVYADECFVRIYDGSTGEVLYSAFRTSCTWYENPVVADPDKDSNTEIVVNSNQNCSVACPAGGSAGTPFPDPIHPGERCIDDSDCPARTPGSCNAGFCRCATDAECANGQSCVTPLAATPGTGNVCRATHPNSARLSGIRVLRERLDRWTSSRPMWNQHAYSVSNINDDGSIPQTSSWTQNFLRTDLNNYRQNVQGGPSSDDFPDITGKLDQDNVCATVGSSVQLTATVCNRGLKAVGADMPATFYRGDPMDNDILCVSFTNGPVPIGGCLEVSCELTGMVSGVVSMVVNDDGMGGQTTVECIDLNNTDTVTVGSCGPR